MGERILIGIPAFNESSRVGAVVEDVRAALPSAIHAYGHGGSPRSAEATRTSREVAASAITDTTRATSIGSAPASTRSAAIVR